MRQIILASKSPRRKQLLKNIGLNFKVVPSNINEDLIHISSPKKYAEILSLQKAKKVAEKFKDAIIIGADSIVILKGEIIGKPSSLKNAKEILRKLSGQRHMVITGFTVLDSKINKSITNSVLSYVTFKKLSEEEINDYVKTGELMDKAGAYAIQEKAGVFIEKIEGDFFNVVGLPIFALCKILQEFDINISRQ
jgi:septum formation protein